MPEIKINNLASVIDSLLDKAQEELCPNPNPLPGSKQKLERLQRRREIVARNREMTERYFGLDGLGGLSMEQVGEPLGLTRESVRQITNKVREKLSKLMDIPRNEFSSAINLIRARVPIEKEAMTKELVEMGLWSADRDITSLLAASKIFLKDSKQCPSEQLVCVSENGAEYLLLKGQSEWPKLIAAVAMRLVSHNGAATVEQVIEEFSVTEESRRASIAEKAKNKGKSVALYVGSASVRADLVRYLLQKQERVWLDQEQNWFTLTNAKRNRVINRLSKIFTMYRSVLLVDVAEGIKRSFQKNKEESVQLLPFNVLAGLIVILPNYELKNGIVTYTGTDFPGVILPTEKAMIDFISSTSAGVRREKELEEGVINTISRRVNKSDPEPTVSRIKDMGKDDPEINEYGFSMVLNFSPLILNVMSVSDTGESSRLRGHYRLLGQLR